MLLGLPCLLSQGGHVEGAGWKGRCHRRRGALGHSTPCAGRAPTSRSPDSSGGRCTDEPPPLLTESRTGSHQGLRGSIPLGGGAGWGPRVWGLPGAPALPVVSPLSHDGRWG